MIDEANDETGWGAGVDTEMGTILLLFLHRQVALLGLLCELLSPLEGGHLFREDPPLFVEFLPLLGMLFLYGLEFGLNLKGERSVKQIVLFCKESCYKGVPGDDVIQ